MAHGQRALVLAVAPGQRDAHERVVAVRAPGGLVQRAAAVLAAWLIHDEVERAAIAPAAVPAVRQGHPWPPSIERGPTRAGGTSSAPPRAAGGRGGCRSRCCGCWRGAGAPG